MSKVISYWWGRTIQEMDSLPPGKKIKWNLTLKPYIKINYRQIKISVVKDKAKITGRKCERIVLKMLEKVGFSKPDKTERNSTRKVGCIQIHTDTFLHEQSQHKSQNDKLENKCLTIFIDKGNFLTILRMSTSQMQKRPTTPYDKHTKDGRGRVLELHCCPRFGTV